MATTRILRTVGLATAALLVAASAQAQGKKHERGDDRARTMAVRRADVQHRDVFARARDRDKRDDHNDRYDQYDRYDRYDRRIPPGLAKKPGQMPPGQYKKRYRAYDGTVVLSDILRRRGGRVLRVVPSGESRYVYYRMNDGGERWVLVRPEADRLYFDNAPASLLQAVLARLY
jgi:hypothetical protein